MTGESTVGGTAGPGAGEPGAAAAGTDDILQMRGITKTFPGVKALQDVTLSDSSRQQALSSAFAEQMRRLT